MNGDYGPWNKDLIPEPRPINQWLIWALIVALQIWAAIAWCDPCQVSDGVCAAGQTKATETEKPITRISFTATAVMPSSCTICGKEPQ